jgi:anthranilate phosphoribosyltransferase
MKHLLHHLLTGQSLSVEQTIEAYEAIMTGNASPAQVGALLGMMQMRGPSVDELAGAAKVMRAKAHRVTVPPGLKVIDTCGTGGDHAMTFNISTAAALVTAAAGRPFHAAVAKHGSRAVTSQSGSSQVLVELGVTLEASPQALTRSLDEAGICFCFAPAHHPAMKHALPIRQELGIRTIFNLLGPLTNPAGVKRQLIGVFAPQWTEPVAQVLKQLGSEHAMVVCGLLPRKGDTQGRLDEISTGGLTQVTHLKDGRLHTFELDATTYGLATARYEDFIVQTPADSAAVIRDILAGAVGRARDIVCLNAAAALVVADVAADLATGLTMAQQAIDSGAAKKTLEALVRLSAG